MIADWVYRQFDDVIEYHCTDLRVRCPFCEERFGSPDRDHHLHISIVKNMVHCFRCDYSSSHAGLVQAIMGCSYAEALQEIGGIVNIGSFYELTSKRLCHDVPELTHSTESSYALDWMPADFIKIEDALETFGYINRAGRQVLRYLLSRHIKLDDIYRYNLGTWKSPAGWGTVVIPVERGLWQERKVWPHIPKYKSSMSKGYRFFNWQALNKYSHVVIAEGAFSAIALGKNAVALLGKSATDEQIARLISGHPTKYTVALDSDAIREAILLADALYRGGKDVVIRRYSSGDPNDGHDYIEVRYDWAARAELLIK